MFNLIPWKKRHSGSSVPVHRAEPSRQEVGPLADYPEEIDMLWNRLFDRWASLRGLSNLWDATEFDWSRNVGWEDKEDKYVFHAELPGFEPEDFDVKVSGNTLTVRAEHKEETHQKKGDSSYRYGSFTRTCTLPSGVDEGKINARYHSGVLEVDLPKTEQARGKRIPVTSAG